MTLFTVGLSLFTMLKPTHTRCECDMVALSRKPLGRELKSLFEGSAEIWGKSILELRSATKLVNRCEKVQTFG